VCAFEELLVNARMLAAPAAPAKTAALTSLTCCMHAFPILLRFLQDTVGHLKSRLEGANDP
jgi:hypothetical protein